MKNSDKKYSLDLKLPHYKLNIKWIFPIFILVVILSYIGILYVKYLTYKNVYNNITELSEQTATQLDLIIEEQKKFVEIMVDSIDSGYFNTPLQIFDRFKNDLVDYHFTRLVILDKNGNGSTSDGHIVKNYTNIEEFFKQDSVYLSENRPSTVSNNQVNIYSKTFYLNDEKMVLFATINTENYKEILLRRLFNGEGGTYLINNNGVVLIDSFGLITENNVNLYDYLKSTYSLNKEDDIYKVNQMASNIKNNQVGTFDIKLHKNTYFIHYEKLNVNDWYVVSFAPDESIAKELTQFLTISFCVCIFITFIIVSICIYIDFSNQQKSRKLYKVAYMDPITLLGNEFYFKEKGSIYLQDSPKSKYIISLDINKFKALNKIYGYEYCNNILKVLGEKLSNILPNDNITCRMSSDIFASIFEYEHNIKNLLNKLLHELSSINVNNTNIHINLSIGVYKTDLKDTDINKILDKAYLARAKIKGLYHINYYIFDEILENQLLEEQQIEFCMEEALKNKEFKIIYQPKTSTNSEKVIGAEALVRWYKKDGSIIPPNKFIPLFEKNKFIIKLDLYIFEQVCRDITTWKEKYNFTPIISINVSKEHFIYENFIIQYTKICNKYDIDKSLIDLEITESATIDEKIDIFKILNNIRNAGFMISIDDFGTGYSSLSMLQDIPIDVIKIDKIFIDKANLQSDNNVINYIMFIAKHLGVKTIVEGVETKEQVDFIRKLQCDVIQGFYYSKPLSKEDFENYFNEHK